jgi:hypothetical protein
MLIEELVFIKRLEFKGVVLVLPVILGLLFKFEDFGVMGAFIVVFVVIFVVWTLFNGNLVSGAFKV